MALHDGSVDAPMKYVLVGHGVMRLSSRQPVLSRDCLLHTYGLWLKLPLAFVLPGGVRRSRLGLTSVWASAAPVHCCTY